NYIVRIRVTNTGAYDLQNVKVTDELGTFTNCFTSPLTVGGLAVGATYTNDCTFTCNAPIGIPTNFKIAVQGEASQSHGTICAYTAEGTNLVATNECSTCEGL